MTSTADNNNSVAATQPTQVSSTGPKTGSTSPLASLATATDPTNVSSNQQKNPVATFPQRTSNGSPTANNGAPFDLSFSQVNISDPNQRFQFNNPFGNENPPNVFGNQGFGNNPRFAFGNTPTNNVPNFTFNQDQTHQPVQTFTFTSSTQKQEASNHNLQTSTTGHATAISNRLSDPPTPTSEQSSGANQDEEEESTAPVSSADRSLLSKKSNTTLRDPKAVIVDRNDPNSPLHPLKTFQELDLRPELLKGIYNMGFQAPSKIQAIALPTLLSNPPKNIIAQSQSGTGKTAAFSLATLSRIDPSIQRPQALILAPTFELAIQIGSVIELMARFLPYIKIAYAVRDPSISKKASRVRGQLLTEPIVIGTPGTVEEWYSKLRNIDLKQLRICCIDEADVMIDVQGFQEMCVRIVNHLNMSTCQMMLFSATYSDQVMEFARQTVPNAVVLRLRREKQALTNIKQYFIKCYSDEAKYQAIEQIYAQLTVGQAMVFCRTKKTAHELAVRMANDGHSVKVLTAALEIEVRAAIIQQFREGIFRVLISTNVTSRGLDIDDVSLVVNYDMPVTVQFEADYETYLHRIGRCGRFGKLGYTFNLIGSERDYNVMKEIEGYFSHPIEEITIEGIGHLEQDQV